MLSSHHTSLTMEEHKAWSKSIGQRLDDIYKELCEYEKMLNEDMTNEPMKLMELLENVNELQRTTAAIRIPDTSINSKQRELEDQMQLLQRSVELLKLEHNSNNSHDETME